MRHAPAPATARSAARHVAGAAPGPDGAGRGFARLGGAARRATALAAAGLALGGCGERRGDVARTLPQPLPAPAAGAGAGAAAAVVEVSLVDHAIVAPRHASRAGAVVLSVTNDGLARHALAVERPAGRARTPELRPGERALLRVRLPPGEYRWYCPVGDHERRGMVGRLRVAE